MKREFDDEQENGTRKRLEYTIEFNNYYTKMNSILHICHNERLKRNEKQKRLLHKKC